MYLYLYLYSGLYTHTHTHAYIYICIYTYMYVYVYIYIYVCMYMYVYVCICMYMYVYVCICMYMYVYVYICLYIHIYIYIYICTCTHIHIYTHRYTWEFPKISDTFFGVLIMRILLFRVLYWGPLFSETPACMFRQRDLLLSPSHMLLGQLQQSIPQNVVLEARPLSSINLRTAKQAPNPKPKP